MPIQVSYTRSLRVFKNFDTLKNHMGLKFALPTSSLRRCSNALGREIFEGVSNTVRRSTMLRSGAVTGKALGQVLLDSHHLLHSLQWTKRQTSPIFRQGRVGFFNSPVVKR